MLQANYVFNGLLMLKLKKKKEKEKEKGGVNAEAVSKQAQLVVVCC